ncbi:MAG TPA: DEAD/DEAH box helicase, partial [Gammaproteobacteria bacterium]|nr:DEAD/DEAH box helicase [Gammaproteobacteria bacterium]
MAQNPDELRRSLDRYLEAGFRGRLRARGIARGIVWRDGVVPDGSPVFDSRLTSDLLDFGYAVLALGLELRDANRTGKDRLYPTADAFEVAAEAIEAAARRGNPEDGDQGRHLVIGATAFHLAGFAARSFSLLPPASLKKNLSTIEHALALLLRRDLLSLRNLIVTWLGDEAHSDPQVASRLADELDEFEPEDAVVVALTKIYLKALGLADTALFIGDGERFAAAIGALERLIDACAKIGNIPAWWAATLTRHLLGDLWDQSLHVRLPDDSDPDGVPPSRWTRLRRNFIAQLAARTPPQIDLWPSQLEAARRSVNVQDHLVIALPTSAGKTRIAELCILRALADRKRVVYVTPLRALSAQVERILARTFIPLGATVTSLYGAIGTSSVDSESLASAAIVVATPEKLDFALRQDPATLDDVGLVVFDEGHMIGLGSREIRYEVLIQRLLRRSDASDRRIVCLSAMFSPEDSSFKTFADWLRQDADGTPIHVDWRPTRRRF